ncbi:type I toxin-antitoxin system Ibs family toxin, partial [Escherichia coli]
MMKLLIIVGLLVISYP